MVKVLEDYFPVLATDISEGADFLKVELPVDANAIITNPPFSLATEFIVHALELMKPVNGFVAMLQSVDFDSAKCRRHLFRNCPEFMTKIVLTKRIVWFEREDGKKAAPSSNHAWYIWGQGGPPAMIVYEP